MTRMFSSSVTRYDPGSVPPTSNLQAVFLKSILVLILYSSPSIIIIINSRRMRCAGHVARMGEKRNAYIIDYWWESQKEGDH
jgi:hypothetical protein